MGIECPTNSWTIKLSLFVLTFQYAEGRTKIKYINICEGWAYIICSLLYSSVTAYLTCNSVNIKKEVRTDSEVWPVFGFEAAPNVIKIFSYNWALIEHAGSIQFYQKMI